MKRDSPQESSGSKSPVLVAAEDAEMVRKIRRIMGLDRAIRCGNDTKESVYNDRGILFL